MWIQYIELGALLANEDDFKRKIMPSSDLQPVREILLLSSLVNLSIKHYLLVAKVEKGKPLELEANELEANEEEQGKLSRAGRE